MAEPRTRILNLDELPTINSVMTIVHEGVDHHMAIMTVEAFIDQEKRAEEHSRLVKEAIEKGESGDADGEEFTQRKAIEIMSQAVQAFFPTLPVSKLPTHKLLTIFAWLNETSAAVNADGAAESAEGNGEGEVA